MKTILGYSDRFSIAAGDGIRFFVSSEMAESYTAQLVRVISGDTNPAGPGYREEIVPSAMDGIYPGRKQVIRAGSCAAVPALPALESFAIDFAIWPTMPAKPGQILVSLWRDGHGFALLLDGKAGLTLRLGDGARTETIRLGKPVLDRHWYRVTASFDAATGQVTLTQAPLRRFPGTDDAGAIETATQIGVLGVEGTLVFAAEPDGSFFAGHYNGKIDGPRLWREAAARDDDLLAAWDFSRGISGERIVDTSGHSFHGTTRQLPARGVTGHNWTGEERSWRHAPAQYGAIHFHDDDICDAGWEVGLAWTVPAGLKSGLYALKLTTADDEDYIPFVVRPPRGTATAKLLLILPDASYLAYANEHLAIDAGLAERVHDHVPVFTPGDVFLAEHREFGGSLYDRHSDGSGIYYSSRLRPILNMRPKVQSWLGGGTGSSLWQLNADTHIIAWLEAEGIPYDCVSDEDLHIEGPALLERHRCVITATHPEYTSTAMFDAFEAYTAGGGRLVSLGGNAYYWRIAFHPEKPGVIEVRRCEVGNGWITPPGESHHSFNGEYGGLWSRVGRPPNLISGTGFIAQGFDICSFYRRRPDSFDPRAAFIFEGVGAEERIGDFGLIGGGAAGIELDCADTLQGTPANALVLATSEGHTNNYLPTLEALLINYGGQGGATSSLPRADMVFFATPAGGAVFSTGSIAWSGSLAHDGFRNNVARITGNVVRRFLADDGF